MNPIDQHTLFSAAIKRTDLLYVAVHFTQLPAVNLRYTRRSQPDAVWLKAILLKSFSAFRRIAALPSAERSVPGLTVIRVKLILVSLLNGTGNGSRGTQLLNNIRALTAFTQ
jgi:hypothetical protein